MPQHGQHAPHAAVCIVRYDYYPDGHVSRDAVALAQAGYRVSVIALHRAGEPRVETRDGVTVYRLPVQHRRGNVLRYVWQYGAFFVLAGLVLSVLHARRRFAIVEVDNMPDVLVFTALIPKLTGSRVILYIFDNMPELLTVARGFRPEHPLVRLLARLETVSAAFADKVIVTQEPARRVVEARGVSAAKLAVVLNCPDETVFDPSVPRIERPADGTFEIVTHGAIVERYGIQVLIDALPGILERIPNAHVHVFGQGEYRGALEERARRNGVSAAVHFRGLAPLDELLAQLRRADVGYVGMLCDLMLSNKLVEYVALGVPTVVARWPTYRHYYADDAVTYFAPGSAQSLVDAVCRVHDDPEQARGKAAHARELYQVYRWGIQRELYLRIYAQLRSGRFSESTPAEVAHGSATR